MFYSRKFGRDAGVEEAISRRNKKVLLESKVELASESEATAQWSYGKHESLLPPMIGRIIGNGLDNGCG